MALTAAASRPAARFGSYVPATRSLRLRPPRQAFLTMIESWPSVGVVIPTRDRPEELRRALTAVLAQDYPGHIEVVIVFDGSERDDSLESSNVRTLDNSRSPGLAGARNSGILSLDTDLVAFCDDDDEWLPGKLEAQ